MQYLGNFTWQKENGKTAHVIDNKFIGFNGKPVKTIPNNVLDLIVSITEAGSVEDLDTLFGEVTPFCNASHTSRSFKLYEQMHEFLNQQAAYKDTANERIAKVIANNEGISYISALINYANLIDWVLNQNFSEKEIIAALNYIFKNKGQRLSIDKNTDILLTLYRLRLNQFLPNNGEDVPQDQMEYVMQLILHLKTCHPFAQNKTHALINLSLPAIATWIRNGQIRNALLLGKNGIYLSDLFRQSCIMAYKLGYQEFKVNGNPLNKLAELLMEWKDRQNQIFRERIAKLAPKLLFEDDDYIVRIPQCEADFIREGEENHNCVGTYGYYRNMSEGRTCVVFVRKKTNPDKAFVTCEIRNDGTIKQFLGRRNLSPGKAAMNFAKKYQIHLMETFKN